MTKAAWTPKFQAIDASGNPYAGGKLYTYAGGTTTPLATYSDQTGGTPNANPVVLDSAGRADVWLTNQTLYKLVLKDSSDSTIWTVDNFSVIDGVSIAASQTIATLSVGAGGLSVTSTGTLSVAGGATSLQSLSATTLSVSGGTTSAPSTTASAVYKAESPASFTGTAFSSNSVTAAGTGWNHMYCSSSNNTVANAIIYGNGNIQNANNSYGAISDARLKEDIQDAKAVRDRALLVRLVSYRLKSDPAQKQLGVIAQEIQSVFPGLIEESQMRDKDGEPTGETYLTVKYSVLSLILFKAWQESEAIRDEQMAAIVARLDAAGIK